MRTSKRLGAPLACRSPKKCGRRRVAIQRRSPSRTRTRNAAMTALSRQHKTRGRAYGCRTSSRTFTFRAPAFRGASPAGATPRPWLGLASGPAGYRGQHSLGATGSRKPRQSQSCPGDVERSFLASYQLADCGDILPGIFERLLPAGLLTPQRCPLRTPRSRC